MEAKIPYSKRMSPTDDRAASTGKLIAGGSTVLAAVVATAWGYIGQMDSSRIGTADRQDHCAAITRERADQQGRTALALEKLAKRQALTEDLLVEIAAQLVGHAGNPRKKFGESRGLTRALQRINAP